MKLLLAQVEAALGNKDANLFRMREIISTEHVNLAVFPELFLSGYMVRDEIFQMAETIKGPSVGKVREMAREFDCHVLFGMAEKSQDTGGLIYNSSVMVCPDGKTHAYRKVHLANFGPFEEGYYFAEGTEGTVVDTGMGKVGLQICYDAFFPELAKISVLRGADIIINISAAPGMTVPNFEKVLPARAVENTAFVAYCNNVGCQKQMVFGGGSFVMGPRGDFKTRAGHHEEKLLVCEIDLEEIRIAREFRPTIRNTKVEMLKGIIDAMGG